MDGLRPCAAEGELLKERPFTPLLLGLAPCVLDIGLGLTGAMLVRPRENPCHLLPIETEAHMDHAEGVCQRKWTGHQLTM